MNKQRRKDVARAVELIEEAQMIIDQAEQDEQDAFDNLPETFQEGERGQAMQEAVSALQEAARALQEAIDQANGAIQ